MPVVYDRIQDQTDFTGSLVSGYVVSWNGSAFTLVEVPAPDLSNYVTLDGTQTISGAKTFSSTLVASGRILAGPTLPTDDGSSALQVGGNVNVFASAILMARGDGYKQAALYRDGGDGVTLQHDGPFYIGTPNGAGGWIDRFRVSGTGDVTAAGSASISGTLKPGTINTGTTPGTTSGQLCIDTTLGTLHRWDGSDWIEVG